MAYRKRKLDQDNDGCGDAMVSDRDIQFIANKATLSKDEFQRLFGKLDLTDNDIENEGIKADTKDIKLQADKILKFWRQRIGERATRQAIVNALHDLELDRPKGILEKRWTIQAKEDNLSSNNEEDEDEAAGRPIRKMTRKTDDDGSPTDGGEIEPDGDGRYTDYRIKAALPTPKQLDISMNYDMYSSANGLAFVLNIKSFPVTSHLKSRNGSEVDFYNMQHLFAQLRYHVIAKENLTSEEIRDELKRFSGICNNEIPNSIVVVMMSHGKAGKIYGSDAQPVDIKELEKLFDGTRCPGMENKPKLFFYQACRVEGNDDADTATSGSGQRFALVVETADIFCAYATTHGHQSLRHTVNGSWFTQAICEVFLKSAASDNLDELMNKVTNLVTAHRHVFGNADVAQQTPERVSTLRKTLYFLPGLSVTFSADGKVKKMEIDD